VINICQRKNYYADVIYSNLCKIVYRAALKRVTYEEIELMRLFTSSRVKRKRFHGKVNSKCQVRASYKGLHIVRSAGCAKSGLHDHREL